MSNLFSKHLHLCFFKLKFSTTAPPLSPPPHPQHHHSPSPPSTSLLFIDAATSSSTHSTDDSFSSSGDSDSSHPSPPDFAAVYSSQRFFFSSPGTSNSIIESPDTRRPCNSAAAAALIPQNGVGVPKYSLDPYADFQRSMREMIESRENVDVRKDWDYLHELLLCYLALNPAHTHKYIVRAFTDLVVELLSSRASPPVVETSYCRKIKNRRNRSFSGRLV